MLTYHLQQGQASLVPTRFVNTSRPQSSKARTNHQSILTGKRNTNPNTSLIQIEGVDDPKAARFYLGKRIAYVYRGKTEIRGTKIRVIWGKVTRTHGEETLHLWHMGWLAYMDEIGLT